VDLLYLPLEALQDLEDLEVLEGLEVLEVLEVLHGSAEANPPPLKVTVIHESLPSSM